MRIASLKFESLGDVAKLVFRGRKGRTSADFTGADVTITVNDSPVLKADSKKVSIPILQTETISNEGKEIKIGGISILNGKVSLDKGISINNGVLEKTSPIKIGRDSIVGTDKGSIGHPEGALLLESPGEDTVLELISAVLIYNFKDAAYTGGEDNVVIKSGISEISGPTASKDLVCAEEDSILLITPMASFGAPLIAGKGLRLCGTPYKNLDEASGEITGYISYRIINIGM